MCDTARLRNTPPLVCLLHKQNFTVGTNTVAQIVGMNILNLNYMHATYWFCGLKSVFGGNFLKATFFCLFICGALKFILISPLLV